MSFFGKDKDKEEVKEMPVKQTGSLKERLDRINKSRWIRFGIVSALWPCLRPDLWLGGLAGQLVGTGVLVPAFRHLHH